MSLVFAGRSGGVDANVFLWFEFLLPNEHNNGKKATLAYNRNLEGKKNVDCTLGQGGSVGMASFSRHCDKEDLVGGFPQILLCC
jgi:hypothetical protein